MVMPKQTGALRPHTSTYARDSISGVSYNAITDGSHLVSSSTIAGTSSAAGRASRQTRVKTLMWHLTYSKEMQPRCEMTPGNLNETDQS